MTEFTLDIENIRQQARAKVEEGAVTASYQADREKVLHLLDAALATEWLCVLRYTQHSIAAEGIHSESVAKHFASHASQEQEHANQLANRIKQLGGNPDLSPESFSKRGHSDYKECDSLEEMIRENLIAERIAIQSYTQMIRYIGESDPTTRRLLESILETEEEHADEMADLLSNFDHREKLN
ncbi:MAG: ferritin-like domain-containing protein [Oligoflexus sp.]